MRCVLAGRIMTKSGDPPATFVLADALDALTIEGVVQGEVGDWVCVCVKRTRRGPRLVRTQACHPPVSPPHGPLTETWRFLEQGIGKNLAKRAQAMEAVRHFFRHRGFLEIDPPALVPSPGLDLHLDAMEADGRWLATSPEYQMKRLLAGGLPRIYALCHVYRKGEVGGRHNPEFTMIEWYRAFAEIDRVMTDTEELVRHVAVALTGAPWLQVGERRLSLERPFARISVVEAFSRYAGLPDDDTLRLAEHDEEAFFRTLVERVEPALAACERPIFLHDFPITQASLARAKPTDPRVCERFELHVAGVELCNGFGELVDPVEQRARLTRDQAERLRQGKPVYPVDERFVAALAEGMPPSSGNAVGFDRLLALCLREQDISRVMPFPAAWL